jgi:toxin ParE1/3/4
MKVTIHPAAENDIVGAATFYEREGSPVVAARFIAEFNRLARLIAERPEIGAPRNRGRRGISMSVFPYSVIYRAGMDEVRILIVKHDRKHPRFGGGRV